MDNLQDLIGFLEHLKSLNKTKIEIDSVLKNLVEIKEKQLTICGVSQQRELLVAYEKHMNGKELYKRLSNDFDKYAESFLATYSG